MIPDGAVADLNWLPGLTAQAQKYVEAAKSENTRRAYRSDWAHFVSWCQEKALAALPADPASLILYLTEFAGQAKVSTLTRRLSAISQAHQLAGHATPTHDARVRTVMAGIRRTRGTAPQTKRPVLVAELKCILDSLPSSLLGVRDRVPPARRLERRVPALRISGARCGTPRGEPRGSGSHDRPQQNRSGRAGKGRRIRTDGKKATCPVQAVERWRAAGQREPALCSAS